MRSLVSILLAIATLSAQPAEGDAFAQPPASGRVDEERLVLRTNHGDLVIALFPDVAPRRVEQIKRLVKLGAYDTTFFVRVRPGFYAQLSSVQNRLDPLTKEQEAAIGFIAEELSTLPHRRGTVSVARTNDETKGARTSFGILLDRAAHLDGKFTIFGELESGVQVLAGIARLPLDDNNAPQSPVVVQRALLRTPAQLTEMRWTGELREDFTSASSPQGLEKGSRTPVRILVGLGLMVAFSLLAFHFALRAQPKRLAAVCLVSVLVGAFFLLAELVQRSSGNQPLAVAVFVAALVLFRLMNRMESS
jgi:peptidylprolyl isomerase